MVRETRISDDQPDVFSDPSVNSAARRSLPVVSPSATCSTSEKSRVTVRKVRGNLLDSHPADALSKLVLVGN